MQKPSKLDSYYHMPLYGPTILAENITPLDKNICKHHSGEYIQSIDCTGNEKQQVKVAAVHSHKTQNVNAQN